MNLAYVLIVVLIIVLLVGSPYGGFHSYGWGPSGLVGVVIVVVIILLLLGKF